MEILRTLFLAIIFSLSALTSPQIKHEPERIPDEIMNAEFQSVDGSASINLRSHRDEVIVLAVWASWCEPCRMVISGLNDFNRDFSSRGVAVIGLNTETTAQERTDVRLFLENNKIHFKLGWLDEEKRKILLAERDVVPQFLIVRSDGVLVKRLVGWNQEHTFPMLREAIEEELIKPTSK